MAALVVALLAVAALVVAAPMARDRVAALAMIAAETWQMQTHRRDKYGDVASLVALWGGEAALR